MTAFTIQFLFKDTNYKARVIKVDSRPGVYHVYRFEPDNKLVQDPISFVLSLDETELSWHATNRYEEQLYTSIASSIIREQAAKKDRKLS